jgi:spore maturation protein CgeB
MRIVVVGGAGGTNVGESLRRAAGQLNLRLSLIDHAEAYKGPPLAPKILWRLTKRPWRLNQFSEGTAEQIGRAAASVVIATGATPLRRREIETLRREGIYCINFSTDDPWNPAHRSRWHFDALPAYDIVFTPRRSNIGDLRALGCRDVSYLPFGYDDEIFHPPDLGIQASNEVLFVGGADKERAQYFGEMKRLGCSVRLAGSYWNRYDHLGLLCDGQLGPEQLRRATLRAAVNLCLVRRANRDGHVMRSFEIPSVGGFMIAEDTDEHRDLFGPEGECVLYFDSPEQAVGRVRWAFENSGDRVRMAAACHRRVVQGGHTYRDRLRTMLASVPT